MSPPKSTANKISPITIGHVLERDRLFALLRPDSPANAFWISGPGGSGKTTLIASYLEKIKLPCLWYQVDAMDGDPSAFFYYFGQAAATLLSPADPPMPLLTPEYLPNFDIFILRYFETLYQRIEPDSWVIFDNCQDAPDESALSHLLVGAVKQLPPHIKIAIISRSEPPPVMARFMANRTMKSIGWNQLAFTPDEFAAFLEFSETQIAAVDADRLYRFTKGWITGAVLWLLDHAGEGIPSALPKDQTPGNIFDYFVAEILEKSTDEIRQFLLQTAFLPHMTADMAGKLTGMSAQGILETLYRKNFFLEKRRLQVASYQYHPLFREFLLLQADRIFGLDALRSIRDRAAEILEKQGMYEEAISLYSQAKSYKQILQIILSQAQTLVNQGRYATLSAWIDCLLEESSETHSWLLFWKAVALMTSNPRESSTFCARAYDLFVRDRDVIGQILSWSMAVEIQIMFRNGFLILDQLISEGERLEKLLPEDKNNANLVGRFSAAMLLALLLRYQGHPDMNKWLTRCESLLDHDCDLQIRMDLIKNLCWSYNCLGLVRRALIIEKRLRLLQKTENLQPLHQILINVLLALVCILKGDLRECERLALQSENQAEETGIHVFDFVILGNRLFGMGAGNLIEAPAFLAKMQATLSSDATWDHAQYHYYVAWSAMLTGDLAKARNEIEHAVDLVGSCGNPFSMALCRILQSQLYLELGLPDKAENLLTSVVNEPRLGNSVFILYLVNMARAGCAFAQDRDIEAQQFSRKAFAAIRKERVWIPLGLNNRKLAVICAEALEAGIEEDTVVEMINRWHLTPPDAETVSARWPWPIRIYALGRFEILCDGKALTFSAKTPRKPLELLSLLICTGRTGISRERVAETLWHDSDGDLALQALNTSLHRLRKLLGNNETVVQKGGQLLLNRNFCWVDSWHFQWQAQPIEPAIRQAGTENAIAHALALYQGPFTTGQEHLSMAIDYSSQLRKQWLGVIAAAIPLFVESKMDKETRSFLQQALAKDETAAAAFSIMVRDFNKNGRNYQALAILNQCRRLLAEQGIVYGRKTMAFLSGLPVISG